MDRCVVLLQQEKEHHMAIDTPINTGVKVLATAKCAEIFDLLSVVIISIKYDNQEFLAWLKQLKLLRTPNKKIKVTQLLWDTM